jgi:hypothetical protein
MMLMKKSFAAILLLLLTGSLSAEVAFEARVDKLETAYESPIRLELTVKVTNPQTITEPLMPRQLPGFTIGGSGSSVSREGDTVIRRYTYNLQPARSGTVKIPALRVVFTDSLNTDTLVSQPIEVSIAEPLPPPAANSMPTWLVAVCVVVVLAGGFWWFWRSRQSGTSLAPDWREKYRQQLRQARRLVERQDFQGFSQIAVKLLVGLLERRFERNLKDEGLTAEQVERVSELLSYCDSVKYATSDQDPEAGAEALRCLEKTLEPLLH